MAEDQQASRTAPDEETSDAQGSVIIFDPSPVLAIEIERGLHDRTEIHVHGGGQGFWVARMVAQLGGNATLCVPLGNDSGRVLRVIIEDEGVQVRAIEMAGANGTFVHDRREDQRIMIAESPSAELSRHEIDELYDSMLIAGLEAEVTVLTGPRNDVIPIETYQRLATDIRSNGATVMADLAGDALRSALVGGLDLLKISDEEARAAGFMHGRDLAAAHKAAEHLHSSGAENVIVTRAGEPAMALVDGNYYELRSPRIQALDPRGAGDSLTAGLAIGLARGLDKLDMMRLGVAAGAMNVTRHGLGTGNREDIEQLRERVEIIPYEG